MRVVNKEGHQGEEVGCANCMLDKGYGNEEGQMMNPDKEEARPLLHLMHLESVSDISKSQSLRLFAR